MGHSNKAFADTRGWSDQGRAPTAPGRPGSRTGPIHGFVTRHGQTIQFTLDTSQPIPAPRGILPEQLAIAALVLASFVGAIWRMMG